MEQKVCPCVRKNCPRHGDCDACRAHHAQARKTRPVYCEKAKGTGAK